MTTQQAKKSILYVDTNDEITTVISKLEDASGKVVAIVLPKRAPAFQSLINVRLLKKSAQKVKKNPVIITTDKTVLPLAGAAGVYVARTTESKPYIPDAPSSLKSIQQVEDERVDPNAPVGELSKKQREPDDTIDLGDLPDLKLDDDEAKKSKKKKSGVKIPNFNKFRLWLISGGLLLVLLIVGWYMAAFVLPRAEITIETSSQNIVETFDFSVVDSEEVAGEEDYVVPAIVERYEVSDSSTVDTTGQINKGNRADGEMALTNCTNQAGSINVPSGTEFNSGNFVFRTTESATLPPSSFDGPGNCTTDSEDVNVEATEPGTGHNLSERSYNSSISGIEAFGSAMSGGTDDFVSAVDDRDIRAARENIDQSSRVEAEDELVELLELAGALPIIDTFNSSDTEFEASADVGDEADEVTVSAETSYEMTGVLRSDIERLIELQISDEFDLERQAVLDYGLDQASLRIVSSDNNTLTLRLRTIISLGPDIDQVKLSERVAGLSRSETEAEIFLLDGVRNVDISYSPFWVFSTPNDTDKISVTVRQQENDDIDDEATTSEDELDDELTDTDDVIL